MVDSTYPFVRCDRCKRMGAAYRDLYRVGRYAHAFLCNDCYTKDIKIFPIPTAQDEITRQLSPTIWAVIQLGRNPRRIGERLTYKETLILEEHGRRARDIHADFCLNREGKYGL